MADNNLPSDLELDVAAFAAATRAKGCSPFTVQQYRSQLGLLCTWLLKDGVTTVEGISGDHLNRYLIALRERGLEPSSVHAAFRAFRRLLRWYEKTQHPTPGWSNPLRDIEAPRVPRRRLPAPPFENIKAILTGITGHSEGDDRDRALILFLCETGLRARECANLNVGDVDIRQRRAYVRQGKNGRDRYVYFDPPVDKALAQYLRHRGKDLPASAPLWVGLASGPHRSRGSRLGYSGLQLAVRRRAAQAGVPMPQLHGLRRVFATAKHQQGVTALDLQRMLGHSDGQTLWRYVDLSEAYMEQVQHRTAVVANFISA